MKKVVIQTLVALVFFAAVFYGGACYGLKHGTPKINIVESGTEWGTIAGLVMIGGTILIKRAKSFCGASIFFMLATGIFNTVYTQMIAMDFQLSAFMTMFFLVSVVSVFATIAFTTWLKVDWRYYFIHVFASCCVLWSGYLAILSHLIRN